MKNCDTPSARSQCVFSNVLDVFGDRWSLLIVRDVIFLNKHEYREFLASPESIATNILADRLKRLVATGVLAEQPHAVNKSRKLYYLTAKGKALLPILLEMAKWGMVYFPELPAMQSLYGRIGRNANGLRLEVLRSLRQWEKENLITPAKIRKHKRAAKTQKQLPAR